MQLIVSRSLVKRPCLYSNGGSRRLSESSIAAAVGAMADRYFENTLQLAVPDDPPVVREILKAAAVALKVSRAGQLDP